MKKLNLTAMITTIARTTLMVLVLGMTFVSCSKDILEDIDLPEKPVLPGEISYADEGLTHNPSETCELLCGKAADDMTSKLNIKRGGQTQLYTQLPKFSGQVDIVSDATPIFEDYSLDITNFQTNLKAPLVYNNPDNGYYERSQEGNGSFKVNGIASTIEATNLDFAKFFTYEEDVVQLPYTTLDSLTWGGYTIENISEAVDGYKTVTVKLIVNANRSIYKAAKMTNENYNNGERVSKTDEPLVSEIAGLFEFKVAEGVEPIDEYTGFGNVRREKVYDWNAMEVRVKVLCDEYWSLSGAKTVVIEEAVLPFGFIVDEADEYVSTSKNLTKGSEDHQSSEGNEVDRRKEYTLTSVYGIDRVDGSANKTFIFWYTDGYCEKDGERIDFEVGTPTMTWGGVSQVSETSNATYATITKYDVKHNIGNWGVGKTVKSQTTVKVEKGDEPVTVKNVILTQSKVVEDARTVFTVKANITYSDGTTAVADTVVYRAHGASNAAALSSFQADKAVAYVSSNVTPGTSGNRINYNNAVIVRYADNTTDVMNFASFQEVGGTITFWGKTIELQITTMVPSYVSLLEGATVESGNYNVTTWTVNAKSVIGPKSLPQSGNVTVSVEKEVEPEYIHPVKGKLLGAYYTLSNCNTDPTKFYHVFTLHWSNGYENEVDNVMQPRFWLHSEFSSSMAGKINSATSKGPGNTWMPAEHKVDTKSGYWTWITYDSNGQQYYTSFPYKLYPQYQNKPNHCVKPVTCEFVGDKMIVKENGVVIRTFDRM